MRQLAKKHNVSTSDLIMGMVEAWRPLSELDKQRLLGQPAMEPGVTEVTGPKRIDGMVVGTWLQRNL